MPYDIASIEISRRTKLLVVRGAANQITLKCLATLRVKRALSETEEKEKKGTAKFPFDSFFLLYFVRSI